MLKRPTLTYKILIVFNDSSRLIGWPVTIGARFRIPIVIIAPFWLFVKGVFPRQQHLPPKFTVGGYVRKKEMLLLEENRNSLLTKGLKWHIIILSDANSIGIVAEKHIAGSVSVLCGALHGVGTTADGIEENLERKYQKATRLCGFSFCPIENHNFPKNPLQNLSVSGII